MATTVDVVEFTRSEPGPLVRVFDELAAAGGPGWINIGPVIDEEARSAVPDRSGLAGWFAARGPSVPMATWIPPARGRRPRPAEVGLAHGTGPGGLDRLAAHGVVPPDGWRRRQDHAKRGIVLELPADVDHRVVVEWLVGAMSSLSELAPTGDEWVAEVHRPS